jgi:hypothetical protein
VGGDDLLNPADLRPGKSTTPLQPNWVKPKFCDFVLALNMHMWRFIAISSIEEKTKWPDPQYGWHLRQTYITFATQKYRKQPVEHTTILPVRMTEKDASVIVSAKFAPADRAPRPIDLF